MEITRISLTPADTRFREIQRNSGATRWFFEGIAPGQIKALFERAELTADQKDSLKDASRWQAESNGWWIRPTQELVREMSPAARQTIYRELRRSRKNPYHRYPFLRRRPAFEAWLAGSGLSVENKDWFRKMTYLDGEYVCFSDCVVMEALCTDQEIVLLSAALSQIPALMVHLRVNPGEDTAALIRYWGRAGRGELMKPLLDSLARRPEGGTINVSWFFPDLMRSRLFTYPVARAELAGFKEDCFWTAMNFLNPQADDRFFQGTISKAVLASDYDMVRKRPFLFGDLMILVDEKDVSRHMCVYVADHVVFTKNGQDPLEPWILMEYEEMRSRYRAFEPLSVVVFRKKKT